MKRKARAARAFGDPVEAQRRNFEGKIADLEARLRNAHAQLPSVKQWRHGDVCYQGELRSHHGSTYQAARDCSTEPPSANWRLVTAAGRDAAPANSMTLRNEYDRKTVYSNLDVVTKSGSCWVALKDNPGVLGESTDWMLLAAKGERGESGPRGHKGDRGAAERPVPIVAWQVDKERYRGSPLMSNGSVGAQLELRSLFETIQIQTT
jgi:hypothetical protein